VTRITGALREDVCTFMTIGRRMLLRIINVSEKNCSENQNTLFMLINVFTENRAIFESV